MNKNYYQILGLEPSATASEIKKAYRLYASKFHPDKHQGDKFFEEKFKEIKEAYDTLSDENKRRVYDETLFGKQSNYHSQQSNSEQTSTDYQSQTSQKKEQSRPKSATHKPKSPVEERRTRNMLIGAGTIIAAMLIFNIGGLSGLHVPVGMFFIFWSIRQIFAVLMSYVPD